jgi:prepilin-type N-terminal cleavage/methylation domain-containing protein
MACARRGGLRSAGGSGGFTLIEVMIAVLILLVGMLGVVGMQMLSLQANQGAYFRSQAIYIGSEILDAMRANPGGGGLRGTVSGRRRALARPSRPPVLDPAAARRKMPPCRICGNGTRTSPMSTTWEWQTSGRVFPAVAR